MTGRDRASVRSAVDETGGPGYGRGVTYDQQYALIDARRHDLYQGMVDAEKIDAAMVEPVVQLKAVADPGNPAHYRARVVVQYAAQALRALDSLAHAGEWDVVPALRRLPDMCPEPQGTGWREASDPTQAWWEEALARHEQLRGATPRQQAATLCELIGLCAAVLDWFAGQGVESS